MDDQTRPTKLDSQTKRAQGGVGAPHLHEGGPGGNPSGPRSANDPGSTRSGDRRPAGEHRRDETTPNPSDARSEPHRAGTPR